MKGSLSSFKQLLSVFTLAFAVLFGASAISAATTWTGPTASPPNANVPAPINVGSGTQSKSGALGASLLYSSSGLWLTAPNSYLNFNVVSTNPNTIGNTGYGIRDNNGTLEFKNDAGSWSSIQATIFNMNGGTWSVSGNNIYNLNSGNVGVGT